MKRLLLIISFCLLVGCATITQKAAQSVGSRLQATASRNAYPSAQALNSHLAAAPPTIDLSQYQSVENTLGRPHQRPDLAIAIAASGGGYRAANLTAGVLMGLEQITDPHLKGNLLEEVDYFSTVSGGGFGVGYYLASLYDFMQLHGNDPFSAQFSFTNTINHLPDENPLDKDYSGDLFFADNRGEQIEQSLAESILHTQNGTLRLGDIFVPKNADPRKVMLPYWVTNSTIYQNAAVLPFTPDVLAQYGVDSYDYNGVSTSVSNPYAIPAAVGMAASASFPFALTPTTLGSNMCTTPACYLQLVDGGLSDNLGINTALNLLDQDPAKTKVLIVIDAYAGDDQPFSQSQTPPSGTTLLSRVMGMGTDASRQMMKRNINKLAQEELCHGQTKNVSVIYLDLENYDKARAISTGLFLTRKQQKILLNVGQSLVNDNPQISQLLKPMLEGNMSIGRCQAT
jgi:predicted acylesterase/phospholipase RssA